MEGKIVLKDHGLPKVALQNDCVIYIDCDGKLHVFSDTPIERHQLVKTEGYRNKYDEIIHYKWKEVDFNDDIVPEKVTDIYFSRKNDVYRDGAGIILTGKSGKKYLYYNRNRYHNRNRLNYIAIQAAMVKSLFYNNTYLARDEKLIKFFTDFDYIKDYSVNYIGDSRIYFVLFNDGTLHSWNCHHNSEVFDISQYDADFLDETIYDDIDIPDELIGKKIKSIHSIVTEGIIAIDESDKVYIIGNVPDHFCEALKHKDLYSQIKEYKSYIIGIDKDNRLKVESSYWCDEPNDILTGARYMRNVIDFDICFDIYGEDVGIIVNKDSKLMLFGKKEECERYESMIPDKFLA